MEGNFHLGVRKWRLWAAFPASPSIRPLADGSGFSTRAYRHEQDVPSIWLGCNCVLIIDPDMRVLLVDDNVDALTAAGALFAAAGHIVTVASNPHEALAHACATSPEVVILDIRMPRMSGYELAHAIRALDLKPRPLIIAVSGHTASGDVKRGHLAGFDYHYPKTIDPKVILDTVSEHAVRLGFNGLHDPSDRPH